MDAVLLRGMKALHGPSLAALKKEMRKRERVWIDLGDKESDVLQEFGLSRALFRSMNRSELPLYREFNNIVCLLAFNLRLDNSLAKERLHLYVTKEFVITVNCRRYMDAFRQLGKSSATPEDVMCFVLLEVSEDNERVIEAVEERIDGVEEKLIRRHEIHVEGLLGLKRTILAMNKIFWHERDMLFYLRHCAALEFSEEARVELDEAHNSLLYCIDLNGTFREILTDSLDVYHTVLSNKINFAIKRLTVVTVILAIVATVTSIPNTIATIFGIPYFPINPQTKLAELLGFDIFTWDLIVILIVVGAVVPSFVLFWWWNRVKQESEESEARETGARRARTRVGFD